MQKLRVSITATSDRFDADDDRWLSQVRLLLDELGREVPLETRHTAGERGAKSGGLPDVVLVIVSAAVGGVVAVIRDWLKYSRDRSVLLQWEEGGETGKLVVTAKKSDNATVQTSVEHWLRSRIRGGEGEEEPAPTQGDPSADGDSVG
ncbi:hypothetical protein [Streptomyces sp. TLI_146]|uniref:hypothetical protein n=1 Tax=Streptomyces sp. TLI_146 TaxID=1938858 RepID=UPI000C7127E6|nr:hypothetical protein [Streptomyces sp. TLI_146]PKV90097.1 hypothetical protein BX283_7762 [Streptomyces sp. TLI_146]